MLDKSVEDYLRDINYGVDSGYVPTDFALEFINFIKLVNGDQGEEHLTPVLHYKMLDSVVLSTKNICNMLFRGSAKTTLLGEYLFLYLGVYGRLPGFGQVKLALYVSDSIENGVKNMRKNLEYRWENSEFLQMYVPNAKFTDVRWEFNNLQGNRVIIKGYGAKALSLDSTLYTPTGVTTIGACKVGDKIYGPDGRLANITEKSQIFHKPMYRLELEDGRYLKVSEDHINSIVTKYNVNNTAQYKEQDITTKELLTKKLQHIRARTRPGKSDYISKENLVFIRNTKPLQYLPSDFALDPYTLGLLLGDGSIRQDGSTVLHGAAEDIEFYLPHIPYTLGSYYVDNQNSNVVSQAITGISGITRELDIQKHGDYKSIPGHYFFGSISQRLSLLQGLLDTDGSIQKNGRMDFCSNSEQLVDDVSSLVRSLGGTTKKRCVKKAFRIEIWISICPFKLPRKAKRFTGTRVKELVAITSITSIADEPSQCIAIDNTSHQFLAGDYVRTHNTGVRGSKEMGVRPSLAYLDDLVSDEDARSATIIASIEDTVYKAVDYALHPTHNKIIWSGTPFNSRDPLYKAIESGAWHVNVYPVCEQFPCNKEDFKGAWEDRFTYEYVLKQYTKAMKAGKVDTFNQELMLRIMSDEDRLIQDGDISWYKRQHILNNKGLFNFYITTDFATSEKAAADFSVISVWAYNNQGDWMWVDGIVKRQLMDANIDELFRLAQEYSPQQVGIEVSGQQGGFIQWIQNEMMRRNVYFPLASDHNGNKPGIRPNTNKMVRFNIIVPWFKLGRVFFPSEMKDTIQIQEAITELSLASASGFKSKHDDFIDTISMLSSLKAWKPSEVSPNPDNDDDGMWDDDQTHRLENDLESYIA